MRIASLVLGMTLACTGGKEPVDDTSVSDDTSTAPLDCDELITPEIEWFDVEASGTWSGGLEFGQTHVTEAEETRLAPPVVA